MREANPALIGTREYDPEDSSSSIEYGRVSLNFGVDGTLLYIVHEKEKDSVMCLKFVVEGDFLITNQESQPNMEKTRYEFSGDGKLILDFRGQVSKYVRAI